jgi:hypothetical protein
MRALAVLFPVVLASCGSLVSQNDIFEQSRAELARREPWAENATILIRESPGDLRLTWKVSAGSFDYSRPPGAHGLRLVPGTERELKFTRDGCLLGYSSPSQRCLSYGTGAAAPVGDWTAAGK